LQGVKNGLDIGGIIPYIGCRWWDISHEGRKMTKPKRRNLVIGLSLGDALRVVEQIHRQGGGGKVPKSSLAPMVGSKATSSLFERKISALRAYGLIDVQGDEVSLTQLGRTYAMPVSPEAKVEAMLQAFKRVPLFDSLLDRYNGSPLPETNEFFYNMVAESYDVPQEEAHKWVTRFIKGIRHIGALSIEAGQEVVRLPGALVGTPSTDIGGENDMGTGVAEQQVGGVEVVDVRILGGKMLLNLPDGVSSAALKKTIDTTEVALDAMRKTLRLIQKEEQDLTED
jgi:hypothetical protein